MVPTSIHQTPPGKSPFTISWTHYLVLLTIKDPDERSFSEIEATNAGWAVPELKRQKASCLYERLALSRDKEGIRKLAREGQIITRPEDLLKEPLVLEFLGLEDHPNYDREVKLPEETPPSASSSANPPNRPSSNSPSPKTPTSTPANIPSTSPPRNS